MNGPASPCSAATAAAWAWWCWTAIGLSLTDGYADFDAERRFGVETIATREHPECIAGDILRGTKLPTDCAAYGTACTPRRPLGAPMVSSEGTCAAFHAAGRRPLSRLSTVEVAR